MNERKRKTIAITTICTILILLFVSLSMLPNDTTAQQELELEKASFVVSSWSYPDSYGQGIYKIELYENSTGSWVLDGDPYEYDDSHAVEWEVGVAIKLRCFSRFNATLTWSPTVEIGERYQQHYVLVTDTLDAEVFSQQNFTKVGGYLEAYGIYIYTYDVVLEFIPEYGEYYTVSILYEIYY